MLIRVARMGGYLERILPSKGYLGQKEFGNQCCRPKEDSNRISQTSLMVYQPNFCLGFGWYRKLICWHSSAIIF